MEPVSASTGPLAGRRVVLGVSGGIAAYKSVELLRLLVKAGAGVQVVMTARAREFVGELTFQTLSGRGVFTDMFSLTQESEIGHIQAADGADLVCIAPATANTLARLAAGMASDPLSAVVLATTVPVLLAPSMNVNMWNAPATRANLGRLIERGMLTVGPGDGFLACNWVGPGRMAEPADILEAVVRALTPRDLEGRHIVVSSGPTREALDPVRFLSNRSTGKMGHAIALAAARRGARVTLVSGPVSLAPPLGVEPVPVTSAAEMADAVLAAARGADAVIMAAAVADFRPADVAADKIKKGLGDPSSITLTRTMDILSQLGTTRSGGRPLLVGFAAETRDVEENARDKLARKGCDLVVANDVSQRDAGFGADTNRVLLVNAAGVTRIDLASKLEVAHAIFDRVVSRL